MPVNKNAFIRYKYLDQLLSDRNHYYNIDDLTDAVNAKLEDNNWGEVKRRCIQKDLETLQGEPFYAPIERFRKNGKHCIAYNPRSFSIFSYELSNEERHLLREVLATLGQFDGLNHFEWLEKFKIGLGIQERRKIIDFSSNPYAQNTKWLGILFDAISNGVVINLKYHTLSDNCTTKQIFLHPYLLKQYQGRWHLIGNADCDDFTLNFPLDRIDDVSTCATMTYRECPDDLMERFEDIVGVTFYPGQEPEHILFWATGVAANHLQAVPFHGSQMCYKGEKEELLRNKYPQFIEGQFFSVDCIVNGELLRELCAYGEQLIVLEPSLLQEKILRRIELMRELFLSCT